MSVDAAAHAAGSRRNIESRILGEEARRMKGEARRDNGLNRKILGARNVVQTKAVPDHDVRIDQRPIGSSPRGQTVPTATLVGVAAGGINLVGMIGGDPELPGHEGSASP